MTAAIEFSPTIGVGTLLTIIVVVAGVVTLFWKLRQGDPSEWREGYLAEVVRREESERQMTEQRELKHEALTELATLKARTDLAPVMTAIVGLQEAQQRAEERMTVRLEAFERNQKQTVEILTRLVDSTSTPASRAA